MKISNFQRDLLGASSFNIEATNDETNFLINFALDNLIRVGMITLEDLNRGNYEIDLSSIPMESFYSAN